MPRAASSEMGAQAREPLDVTARQQKWTPEPQQAGDTGPGTAGRDTGWQCQPVGGIGKPALKRLLCFGTAWASPSPGLKRCSNCRLGPGARSAARNCRLKYFV